jgi:hypothetical protein
MSNLVVANKSDLVAIADAIRTKAGLSDSLSFPQGFIDAINSISGDTEPAVPISFLVDMGGNLSFSSYDAISGMTWSEYVLSEQNTYFSVYGESVYHQPYSILYTLYYDSNFSNNVKPNDEIIDGCTYYAENALGI